MLFKDRRQAGESLAQNCKFIGAGRLNPGRHGRSGRLNRS